jgi:non-ribosomal peptide synthetase component F
VEVERSSAKFDLDVYLEEWPTGLHGYVEYASDLFDAGTIERLVGHYRTLLAAIAADPDQPLRRLPLMEPQERQAYPHPGFCLNPMLLPAANWVAFGGRR